MKKMILLGAVAVTTAMALTGCYQQTSDAVQSQQQSKMLDEATRQTGMPTITNFTQRKQLKAIYEELDKANLITYMYTQNEMDGKWVYQGEAIGFPIPYSTEYTNPSYITYSQGGTPEVIDQADPDGLFHSQSTSGDWIMAIDPTTNKAQPEYMEPNVVVRETKIPAYLCESYSIPKGY